jgi:putative ABC transport system permease protein
MILTIFKTVIRNIIKHRVYSIVNIAGLTIGLTAFILISLFLKYEFSWDKQNEKYDRIYRIQIRALLSGKEEVGTQTPPNLTDLLKDKYPEFEKILLIREVWGQFLSSSHTQAFFESQGFYSEPEVFDMFSYDFTLGDKTKALSDPFSIVLSETMADKLFPNENALGKTVLVEKKFSLNVTGVYKDLPRNSSLRPSYIISFSSFQTIKNWENYRNSWSCSFRTYALLKKGANYKIVNKKIVNFINEHHHDPLNQKIYLLPLSKVYLEPTDKNDYKVAIYIYGLVAIFILILSSINYINLTTSNASIRAKEIAVRKVNGSSRGLLIVQFIGETIVLSLLAACFALFFSQLLLPLFNSVVNRDITFSYINNFQFISVIIIIAIGVGLLSGIYPAFVLSSFKTLDLLKGDVYLRQKNEMSPKRVLVTFQYAISIFLIIISFVIFQQIRYMMNLDLGFDKENLLYVKLQSTREKGSFEDLQNRILKYPEIIDASISDYLPFMSNYNWVINWEGCQPEEKVTAQYNAVGYDYIKTLSMKIINGRNFSREFHSDMGNACIINETACKTFEWSDPIGKRIIDNKYQVIGVVKDFHPFSMHELIPPCFMLLHNGSIYKENVFTIRVAPGKILKAKKILTQEFEEYFPNDAFEFRVFSDDFKKDGNFQTWESINSTFLFFTVLIIFLAIIGIFGLVSFTTQRKTKEIGIRKAYGGSIGSIYFNLIKEFIILLFIASIIAWPAAYFLYQFVPGAYKCGIHIWEFLSATSIVLLMTLITTSYQTVKVSLTNPIQALRYE